MPVHVCIDMRETDLWAQLEPYRTPNPDNWTVSLTPLHVGDIAFYASEDLSGAQPLVVLERKTAEDLGASQNDGRYREQRQRLYALRGAGTAIGYLLEFPAWTPTLSRSWCRGNFNEVHLQQKIVRLQLRYTIPIFQSASIKESVQWIRRIAKTLVADPETFKGGMAQTTVQAAAAYTEAIHVKKADNNTPERILHCMLMSIPGLGKSSVDALMTAVNNSFTTLLTKTEQELAEIKGAKKKLGASLAHTIYAALHS